jgi:hypothetical protein
VEISKENSSKGKKKNGNSFRKCLLACEHERRMSGAILPDNGISVKERHISLEPFFFSFPFSKFFTLNFYLNLLKLKIR